MKVSVTKIQQDEEELATLHIHECTEDVKRLARYIELNSYRSISITGSLNGSIHPVQTDHIIFIEASPNEKLMIHTDSSVYETKKRLYEMASMLPSGFVRISKSVIINTDKVKEYKPLLNGLMQILFHNGDTAYISRKYLREVRNRLMEANYEKS